MWDTQKPPEAAEAALRILESLSLSPYDDGRGFWTIGYGARRDPAGRPVTPNTPPVTEDQAEAMLERDVKDALRFVRGGVMIPIPECQAAALVLLAFNLGELRVAAPTLLRSVNTQRLPEAAKAFSLYQNSAGKPMLGLRRRRWMEAAIFLGGDPAKAHATAWSQINRITDWPPLPAPA